MKNAIDNNTSIDGITAGYYALDDGGNGATTYLDKNKSLEIPDYSNYNTYNINIKDDMIYYYINGNLVKTSSYLGVKYWGIFTGIGQRSETANSSFILHYLTYTDKMTNVIPKPPYTLDKKDNNMYGYKKEA